MKYKELTKEQKSLEEDAIKLGKIWMRKSIDPVHDNSHAKRVVQNSLKIYEELNEDNPELKNALDQNLIKLAGWWHDTYKASKQSLSFTDILKEGKKSSQIMDHELKKYVTEERLNRVKRSVSEHPKVYKYFWRLKRIDPLLRILLEADGLDLIRKDRYQIDLNSKKIFFSKIPAYIMHNLFIIFYKYFFKKTEYGKNVFKRNRSQEFLKIGTRARKSPQTTKEKNNESN